MLCGQESNLHSPGSKPGAFPLCNRTIFTLLFYPSSWMESNLHPSNGYQLFCPLRYASRIRTRIFPVRIWMHFHYTTAQFERCQSPPRFGNALLTVSSLLEANTYTVLIKSMSDSLAPLTMLELASSSSTDRCLGYFDLGGIHGRAGGSRTLTCWITTNRAYLYTTAAMESHVVEESNLTSRVLEAQPRPVPDVKVFYLFSIFID